MCVCYISDFTGHSEIHHLPVKALKVSGGVTLGTGRAAWNAEVSYLIKSGFNPLLGTTRSKEF